MTGETYGAKCHKCGCLLHSGEQAVEPRPWLTGAKCADCSFCQSNAFYDAMRNLGWNTLDPMVREAVKALHDRKPHALIDVLRAEIQAIGKPIEFLGETWLIADASFDSADINEGHWHLTLTKRAEGEDR